MIPIVNVSLGENIGAMTSQEIPVALKEYFVNNGILDVVLYGILWTEVWCAHDGAHGKTVYRVYDMDDATDDIEIVGEYDSVYELCIERTFAELEYYNY